jgi:hypothetical protein
MSRDRPQAGVKAACGAGSAVPVTELVHPAVVTSNNAVATSA